MSPLTDRKQAKESGFAQVRAALQKFKGDVVSAEFGQWGGKLIDEDGKPVPPREFLEVQCTNVKILEVTEELSMPVTEWNFRENCSDYEGSFWVEKFLESTDKFKLLVPDGIIGKRITWERVTLVAKNTKFNSTNYVIVGVEEIGEEAPVVVSPPQPTQVVSQAPVPTSEDPMELALGVAVGKTEAQFRTAIGLDPRFAGSPLLGAAKAGIVTASLLNEGKLVLTDNKYQRPS